MSTPRNEHRDNGIMDSIAALRSVLMLDTPIRDALAVGKKNYEKNQQSQKLSFSSTTTPSSRTNAKHTPISKANGSGSSFSPLVTTPRASSLPRSPEVQESGTKVLAKKIQLLEASQTELEGRLNAETDQKEMLRTTNDKLSQLQAQQASQLEQITESRDKLREETIKLKKTLELERSNHSRTIAFLQSTTSGTMQSEHSSEQESARIESENLKKRLQKSDSRNAESELLVKSLTAEVERLNADLRKLRGTHELAFQKNNESHKKEVADLKNKIEQTESGLVAQINNERKSAEANYEKLQKVQRHQAKLREEHALERGKMKDEITQLRRSLEKAIDEREGSEEKLKTVSNEISQLREELTDEQLAKKESDAEVAKLNAELKSMKSEIATNMSTLPTVQEQSVPSSGSKDVEAEIIVLKGQLRYVQGTRNQLQNQLQEAHMELDGLKQNLEEAERIELQNEVLQEQLRAAKLDAIAKEGLLQDREVESKGIMSSNADGDTIVELQRELKRMNEKLVESQEKLAISSKSNQKRLCEVATHRERARQLEVQLQLEESAIKENPGIVLLETSERKRRNDSEQSLRKHTKARYSSEDEDEIVL